MSVLYRILPEGLLTYGWFGGMHSRFDIAMISDTRLKAEVPLIVDCCRSIVAHIEALANCHDRGSALSRHFIDGELMPPGLKHILQRCNDMAELTEGYFDTHMRGPVPDLSGFLKGYAAERIKDELMKRGICNALINAGNSSIAAIGNPPGLDGWEVAQDVDSTITLCNSAISISGISPDGRHHIVDPHTGKEAAPGPSVVVEGPEADIAEVLSTALYAAPAHRRAEIMLNFPNYTIR